MTLKRERYLELKHERLANCGQCIGFRAKGINLADSETSSACAPAVDCHKSCPALGLGGGPTAMNQSTGGQQPLGQVTGQTGHIQPVEQGGQKLYLTQECHRCGGTEEQSVLLPCRYKGQSLWVCTRCLPALIHG